MERPRLFEGLDGVRLLLGTPGQGPFPTTITLRVGAYANGRPALQAETGDGITHSVLSVNLPDEGCAPDEIFLRFGQDSPLVARVRALVASTHLLVATGRAIDAGFVRDYASVWRLAQCAHGGAPTELRYRVDCAVCLGEVEARYQAQLEQAMASDAVRRLGG